ncbi:calcium-transporting ATPase [Pseudozyma hubeiensis SY62]|uniref:Calcium-transporting ATPase n=1 Tax=Pseudozyma hubeiensis (strain SY62) TaxID=1305764 RepID=R9PLQ1_PSEHS|nr:calcium-transporting ATPase [Pseudozyma hubeiensis SY62]GAC99040.1 calcium-transporting ATPase [Pseudozyma hubeiensis SY62]
MPSSIRLIRILGRLSAFATSIVTCCCRCCSCCRAVGLDRIRNLGYDVFEKVKGFVGVHCPLAVAIRRRERHESGGGERERRMSGQYAIVILR